MQPINKNANPQSITVQAIIHAPVQKVWEYWTEPDHIMKWCQASDDWHAPQVTNDLKIGGRFCTTMAAKDGSVSFDFTGTYQNVKDFGIIEYTIDDGRNVKVNFGRSGNTTIITETFEAESVHSVDQQRHGWQAILNNFKKYAESN